MSVSNFFTSVEILDRIKKMHLSSQQIKPNTKYLNLFKLLL